VPVTFVFVFDRPHRPEVKCGCHIKRQDTEFIKASKELIDMFGIRLNSTIQLWILLPSSNSFLSLWLYIVLHL
ncbi:hypothetical protein L208DRAFT_1334310, partial [Tricholoma matsutake]